MVLRFVPLSCFGNTHLAVPIGGGIRIDLSRKAYLGLEWGQRITASDYLDGVKEAGDGGDNDVYIFVRMQR